MCGITGITSVKPSSFGGVIAGMTDALQHRGPDDWGYVALSPGNGKSFTRIKEAPAETATVFLGHRRLSIIDVSGTQQPLKNEDGSIWTVFNGEIYNYRELADSMIAKGHCLREKGDTETLVHLWEEYGEEMVNLLVGMFAFAIYDTNKDILFLARDRFGQKPLFYWENGDVFAFASELQALKQIDGFPHNDLDDAAVAQYFRYGYIPSPKTVYKNVFSLSPGHTLLRKNGQNSIRQYWKPTVTGEITEVDMDELQGVIDKSVKARLIADVPLGVFLSGGIDSSLVTASMVSQLDKQVKTFTISTGEYWCDESKEARLIADHLKTDHHEFKVEPDFIGISEKLAKHYGQPFADHSSILTYYVSKETRNHVKVALAGDGGDELFAGYGSYINAQKYAFFGRIPAFLRPSLAKCMQSIPSSSDAPSHLFDAILSASLIPEKGENISGLFHKYWRKQGFTDNFINTLSGNKQSESDRFISYYNESGATDPVDRWLEADQRMYLCDDILSKVDVASMAVSLECRAPFLDHRLAEFANRISLTSKLKHKQTKYLLKQLAKRRLPAEIITLPKKGFSMPLGAWMRNELKDWTYSMIYDSTTTWESYLRKETVDLMWNQHQAEQIDHSARLWEIAVFDLGNMR